VRAFIIYDNFLTSLQKENVINKIKKKKYEKLKIKENAEENIIGIEQ
jgi:broad-specificity NMP kinase